MFSRRNKKNIYMDKCLSRAKSLKFSHAILVYIAIASIACLCPSLISDQHFMPPVSKKLDGQIAFGLFYIHQPICHAFLLSKIHHVS